MAALNPDEVCVMRLEGPSNHALQRSRPVRPGCNLHCFQYYFRTRRESRGRATEIYDGAVGRGVVMTGGTPAGAGASAGRSMGVATV